MTLMFYSFFIFGPLQEMGNVIATYREAQASLKNFEDILNTPKEPKPEHPVTLHDVTTFSFDHVSLSNTKRPKHMLSTTFRFRSNKEKPSHLSGLPAVEKQPW
jgi:ATP-binding cassette subfamily B protein